VIDELPSIVCTSERNLACERTSSLELVVLRLLLLESRIVLERFERDAVLVFETTLVASLSSDGVRVELVRGGVL